MANLDTCAVIAAGGTGSRLGVASGKQLMEIAGRSVAGWATKAFDDAPSVAHIVIVCPESRRDEFRRDVIRSFNIQTPYSFANAGATRQDSVRSGIEMSPKQCRYVAVHDGARPLVRVEDIEGALNVLRTHPQMSGIVVGQPCIDTLKIVDDKIIETTPDRARYWTVQTPQIFRRDEILEAQRRALDEGYVGTDDASVMEFVGKKVGVFDASRTNIKVTVPEDIATVIAALTRRQSMPDIRKENLMRVGHGYDVHKLVCDRRLILGGVDIPYEKGLLGHSDADVLAHAIADAILGALREGDIGKLFPDTDPKYKDADSLKLLAEVCRLMRDRGYELEDCDATIAAQAPRLTPYRDQMRQNLASAMDVDLSQVGVKATTTEKLGFVGKQEGIEAFAVVLLKKQMA